jgi:hypothetical protein
MARRWVLLGCALAAPRGCGGGVQIWDLPGSAANCVQWGTGRGGLLRQGYVPN